MAYGKTTVTCNTAMERGFYGVFRDIFKNREKSFYEAEFALLWRVAESAKKLIY